MAMSLDGANESSSSSLPYLSDKALEPFRNPSFDPVDYLNANLSVWTTPTTPSRQQTQSTTTLADLSTQTQNLLSQLNGQLTRLTAIQNQLTDEILRSGGRLAYEVEVLRGDTSALSDVLTDGLRRDMRMFLPSGQPHRRKSSVSAGIGNGHNLSPAREQEDDTSNAEKPDYISRLQTLSYVRTRLHDVIEIFNDAIEWELQPSELSRSSALSMTLSESALEIEAREIKGRDFVEKLRNEVTELSEQGDEREIDAAFQRVEGLRQLAVVWKGTVEERARVKLVDSLAKLVQDRGTPR